MFVVGVTGGIGSGKTAVTDEFAKLGIDIVDADLASRIVVETGSPALAQIVEHFGPTIVQSNGTLDRAALRQIIFHDANEKRWLEQLLHPLIAVEIQRQLVTARSVYVIFVSPLLLESKVAESKPAESKLIESKLPESKQHEFCDRILVVDAAEEMQLQRTILRDSNNADQVRRIMASQATRAQRLEQADDVISNHGSLEDLHRQVAQLHEFYLRLAQQKSNQETTS